MIIMTVRLPSSSSLGYTTIVTLSYSMTVTVFGTMMVSRGCSSFSFCSTISTMEVSAMTDVFFSDGAGTSSSGVDGSSSYLVGEIEMAISTASVSFDSITGSVDGSGSGVGS